MEICVKQQIFSSIVVVPRKDGVALKEAVSYRDSVINNWLLNQGYNINPLDELE